MFAFVTLLSHLPFVPITSFIRSCGQTEDAEGAAAHLVTVVAVAAALYLDGVVLPLLKRPLALTALVVQLDVVKVQKGLLLAG